MRNTQADLIISRYVSEGKLYSMTGFLIFSENTYRNRELRSDFVQQIALVLLEYKDIEKIRIMSERGELDSFIRKIIRNQYIKYLNSIHGKYERGRQSIAE